MTASVYIHIPFCLKKCAYCDFFSVDGQNDFDLLVKAIVSDITKKGVSTPAKIDTIYFGGGTPSILTPSQLESILNAIYRSFDCSQVMEQTIECNPGTITAGKAMALRSLSFNRVSLGVQSFSDTDLKNIDRIHNGSDAINSVKILTAAGFKKINIDLMFALPKQLRMSVLENIEIADTLGASHLSIYGLTIEKGTDFYSRLLKGDIVPCSDEEYEKIFLLMHQTLVSKGYNHYEISNYAKDGEESKHNMKYWCGSDYFGFGPSAHSRAGTLRCAAVSDIEQYIAEPGKKAFCQELNENELFLERLMLELRTRRGISSKLGESKKWLQRLIERELVAESDNRIILTAKGMLLIDEIILMIEEES